MIWPTTTTSWQPPPVHLFLPERFCPQTLVDGQPIQEYLQSINRCHATGCHALERVTQCSRLRYLNEPALGYIGIPDLNESQTAAHR
jgi:hypothetical protein